MDLFSIPSIQAAIESGKFIEYFPLTNTRDGSPVEFHISGSGDEYLDLADFYIHVKVKITKLNGTTLPLKEPVIPVNLLLHFLLSQVDVSLNDRIISSASNTYPYRAYLETLLNYGEVKHSLKTISLIKWISSPKRRADVLNVISSQRIAAPWT